MERRRWKRYDVRVPVVFTWRDPTGADHHGSGTTADISSMGVFVVCEQAVPPVLSPVSLQVLVPSLATRGKRLESAGTVVRVKGKPASGFAAETSEFQVSGSEEQVQ